MWCDEQKDKDFQKWFTQFFTNSVSLGVSAKHETASVGVRAASWYQTFPPTGCWGYHLGIFLNNPYEIPIIFSFVGTEIPMISPLWLNPMSRTDCRAQKLPWPRGLWRWCWVRSPKKTGDVAGEFGPVESRFFRFLVWRMLTDWSWRWLKIAEDGWR